MTNLLQTGLQLALERFPVPVEMQNTAARIAFPTMSVLLTFSSREVTFERHPMHTLHHLLQGALRGEQTSAPGPVLQAVPKHLRNAIYYQVWFLAAGSDRVGDTWGERNALVDLPRLMRAVEAVARERFDSLPNNRKNSVYETMHRMAHLPRVSDVGSWGERLAGEDSRLLMRALHRNGHLDGARVKIPCYSELEREVEAPSQPFHLHREELARGQICFINGMGTSFHDAGETARTLSTASAEGRNIHCVYSATAGALPDITSGFFGQGGVATPAVLELLEQWQDFFETDPESRLLQLCHSRGAIETHNALRLLPPPLRQRIIVIAIAPACLIPAEMAFRVANLVIPSDPVSKIALNRHLMDASHTFVLGDHTDTPNPHSMSGSSYREWLTPRINAYMRTNDILL